MPMTGGRPSALWKLTASAIVNRNSATMGSAPRLIATIAPPPWGFSFGTEKCIREAGTSQLINAGMNSAKNTQKSTMPLLA